MNTKEYKEIKAIAVFCNESDIDTREVYDNLVSNESDFMVDDYRFIHEKSIDEIQQEELKSDSYILGCFTDWFLADILNAPVSVIRASQEREEFETLGEWIINTDKVEELQEKYSSTDGYGHHFSHYDGHELELGDYLVFRTN